jgi:hypothetical protein
LLPSPITTANFRPSPYDETLLAVIGVLDYIRQESNVAGWIRSRGLWAGLERDAVRPEKGKARNGPEAEVQEAGTEAELEPEVNNEMKLGEEDVEPETDRLETSREDKKEKKTKGRHRKHRKKRRKMDDGEKDLYSAEVTERERDDVEAQPDAVNTTTTTTSDTTSNATTSITSPSTLTSAAPTKTITTSFISTTTTGTISIDAPTGSQIHTAWFTDPANLAHWVSKGRQAIRRLGIKEEVGIN